jgi:hypothetical protein
MNTALRTDEKSMSESKPESNAGFHRLAAQLRNPSPCLTERKRNKKVAIQDLKEVLHNTQNAEAKCLADAQKRWIKKHSLQMAQRRVIKKPRTIKEGIEINFFTEPDRLESIEDVRILTEPVEKNEHKLAVFYLKGCKDPVTAENDVLRVPEKENFTKLKGLSVGAKLRNQEQARKLAPISIFYQMN